MMIMKYNILRILKLNINYQIKLILILLIIIIIILFEIFYWINIWFIIDN